MTFKTLFCNTSWLTFLFSPNTLPMASTHHLTLPLAAPPLHLHPSLTPIPPLSALPFELNLHSVKFWGIIFIMLTDLSFWTMLKYIPLACKHHPPNITFNTFIWFSPPSATPHSHHQAHPICSQSHCLILDTFWMKQTRMYVHLKK